MKITKKTRNWLLACTGVGALVAATWGFTKCSADARFDAITAQMDSIQGELNKEKALNHRALQALSDANAARDSLSASVDSLSAQMDSLNMRADSLEIELTDCHNCRRKPARKKASVKCSVAVKQVDPAVKPSVNVHMAGTTASTSADMVKNKSCIHVHGNNNVVVTGNGNSINLTQSPDSVTACVRVKYQKTCVVTVTHGRVR